MSNIPAGAKPVPGWKGCAAALAASSTMAAKMTCSSTTGPEKGSHLGHLEVSRANAERIMIHLWQHNS